MSCHDVSPLGCPTVTAWRELIACPKALGAMPTLPHHSEALLVISLMVILLGRLHHARACCGEISCHFVHWDLPRTSSFPNLKLEADVRMEVWLPPALLNDSSGDCGDARRARRKAVLEAGPSHEGSHGHSRRPWPSCCGSSPDSPRP